VKISIIVTFKKEVLDPQGKVIQQTLKNMGFKSIKNIRQGKYFDIELDEKKIKSYQKAKKPLLITEVDKIVKAEAEDISKKLLANLVIEEYKII
jgi:phosphoribosylformylglycinamidine synthase